MGSMARDDDVIQLADVGPDDVLKRWGYRPRAKTPEQLYGSLPVSRGPRCIRLLDLDAETAGWKDKTMAPPSLSGSLRVASVDVPSSFAALSYVWGREEASRRTIACQDCHLDITENCHQALWHIQKRFGAVTIWVDSICINQADDDEKTGQIGLMGEIYSLATSVYVWLGSAEGNSDDAMTALERRARLGRRIPLALVAARTPSARKRESRRFCGAAFRDIPYRFSSQDWQWSGDTERLLNRRWAHRSWTFQELVLATNPVILCGEMMLGWEDFVSAICFQPAKRREPAGLPPVPVATEHWRSMVHLWLNFPRQAGPEVPSDDDTRAQSSFRNRVAEFWEAEGDLPMLLRWFSRITSAIFFLSVLSLLGLTVYEITMAVDPSRRGPLIGASSGLLGFGILIVLAVALLTAGAWQRRAEGDPQEWFLADVKGKQSRSNAAAVVDGIRGALSERESTLPHDRCFALKGILDACGAPEQRLDYGQGVGETYRNLVETLVRWQPSALILLLDAGGEREGVPSWVPNWDTKKPSQWLSSRYRLGLNEGAVPREKEPAYSLSGSKLTLQGQSLGEVGFVLGFDDAQRASDEDRLRLAFHLLRVWLREAGRLRGAGVGAVFCVLRGLSRRKVPTHKRVRRRKPAGRGGGTHVWEVTKLPDWKAPYDLGDQKTEFEHFGKLYAIAMRPLHSVLPSRLQTMEDEVREQGGDEVGEMMAAVRREPHAIYALEGTATRIRRESRRLFTLSGNLMGTGPAETREGDHVFLLAGIPAPMVLRRVEGQDSTYRVVGAALVHGAMHGELFCPDKQGDVVLV